MERVIEIHVQSERIDGQPLQFFHLPELLPNAVEFGVEGQAFSCKACCGSLEHTSQFDGIEGFSRRECSDCEAAP